MIISHNTKNLSHWLQNCHGKSLVNVFALIYFNNEQEFSSNPQALYLSFAGGLGGCLSCYSDGESIYYTEQTLTETNLGEYGKEVIKDLSNDSFWSKLINCKLISCGLLFSGIFCIGVRLKFSSRFSVDIANLGDELYLWDKIPNNIFKEENIYIKELI